jgi:hypothetical protein
MHLIMHNKTHTCTRTRTLCKTPLREELACCRGLYQQNTQQSQETNVCAPGRIQTCNPSSRAAADTYLRHLEFHLVIVPEVFTVFCFLVIDRSATVRHRVQWSRFLAVCWECCRWSSGPRWTLYLNLWAVGQQQLHSAVAELRGI